jgi:hypothetical protein
MPCDYSQKFDKEGQISGKFISILVTVLPQGTRTGAYCAKIWQSGRYHSYCGISDQNLMIFLRYLQSHTYQTYLFKSTNTKK